MAYDAQVESVSLISSGRVDPVLGLSRRRRFTAMSVDVAGDVAVTTFARRGAGCTWHDAHVLVLGRDGWVRLGGGGGTGGDDLLANRPEELPELLAATSPLGAPPLVVHGAGGIHDDGGRTRRLPWGGRWISYAEVQVTAVVDHLAVGERLVAVPWHGRVAVVWVGRRPPRVTALDRHHRPLGAVTAHVR